MTLSLVPLSPPLEATLETGPVRLVQLGRSGAVVQSALPSSPGRPSWISFSAAGEWFRLPGSVTRCVVEQGRSAGESRMVHRITFEFSALPVSTTTALNQLLDVIGTDPPAPSMTEALQFEIVGTVA